MKKPNEQETKKRLAELAASLKVRMPDVQLLLSQERFLARLAVVDGKRAFVWKGGSLVLRMLVKNEIPRFTIDIDLLLKGEKMSHVDDLFHNAMRIDLNDGFEFLSFIKQPMLRELPYGGEQYEFSWTFFKKAGPRTLKVDVCAGDVVSPTEIKMSEIFLMPMIEDKSLLRVYPVEYMLAEKIETIVRFDTANTRLKDFIDIFTLSRQEFDAKTLAKAVIECFENRETNLSKAELIKILSNDAYISGLEGRYEKNFSYLELPPLKTIFSQTVLLLKSLEIPE